jgi:hypothetical protein
MGFDFSIDMDNLNPAVWFGDEPGKRIKLRLCPPDKIEELRKRCTTVEKKAVEHKKSRQMQIVADVTFDENVFSRLVNCDSIVDWDLTDVNGEAIPCTDENKVKLMGVIPFIQFVGECLKELTVQAGIKQESEIKNFESSLDES